jgi:hypothetical protein
MGYSAPTKSFILLSNVFYEVPLLADLSINPYKEIPMKYIVRFAVGVFRHSVDIVSCFGNPMETRLLLNVRCSVCGKEFPVLVKDFIFDAPDKIVIREVKHYHPNHTNVRVSPGGPGAIGLFGGAIGAEVA